MSPYRMLLVTDILTIETESRHLLLDAGHDNAKDRVALLRHYSELGKWKRALYDRRECLDSCYHAFLYHQHLLGSNDRSFFAFSMHGDNHLSLPYFRRMEYKHSA